MRKLTKLICAVLVLPTLLFVVFGVGTASAKSVTTTPSLVTSTFQHVNVSLNMQQAIKQVLKQSATTNPHMVQPHVNYQCRVINLKGAAGTVCVIIYAECVGPVCVPYAVDINLNQTLIDRLAATGTAGAGVLGTILSSWLPSLSPYIGIVVSVIGYVAISLDTYARNTCGGQGVGIYIGFPSGYYFHC